VVEGIGNEILRDSDVVVVAVAVVVAVVAAAAGWSLRRLKLKHTVEECQKCSQKRSRAQWEVIVGRISELISSVEQSFRVVE
jgi:hypothetical protein